jgi:tetratricopeptide (TPR) repeat protein
MHAGLVAFFAIGLISCGAASQDAAVSARSPERRAGAQEQPTIHVDRTVVTPTDAASLGELYARAENDLAQGRAREAAQAFERVHRLEPTGTLADEALLQAGFAWEHAADREAALARYEEVARRFPDRPLGREGLIRSLRLLAFLEHWERAGAFADVFLARYRDPRPFESIVAYSAKALSYVAAGDADSASMWVEKGRDLIEGQQLDAPGKISRDVAQVYFALGEVRRIKAERIRFVPPPPDFAAVLEQRAQLLLDAQSAYSDTMRAYDAHWSAMAGYRVGELYQKLHEDLMQVAPPGAADTRGKQRLFEGAMRLRYSILLEKALGMMTHTLAMTKRTGEDSAWVGKAEEAKAKIERAIQAEQAAIDRLPYTREQLRTALEDLRRKTKARR